MKTNFYTDQLSLIKAETDEYFEIEGLASTPDQDLQDEIINQGGIDFSDIEYINADHGHEYKDKPGGTALARMGLIDSAKMTKKGLWIKGKVFKNHPEAPIYYNELKHGKPGLVQLSIEGNVLARDPFQKNYVKKCKIRGVALTRTPVNPNTYASLIKSLTSTEVIETPAKIDVDPSKVEYSNLQTQYKGLEKAHQELTQKFYEISSNYDKTVEDLKFIKKSLILSDKDQVKQLIKERAEQDPEFRQQLHQKITKALAPGGAQYATNTPGNISGGSCFMTEDLGDGKKKKKKKKDDMVVVTTK